MSGTALDGVDAAVLQTDGHRIMDFGPRDYVAYDSDAVAVLRAHLGFWQTDDVAQVKGVIEAAHLDLMQRFTGIDLAGFHGQTLAHDPAQSRTHQCGDGANLAVAMGYPVVWDFRTADVVAGGQGAPLAPFYHFALAKWIGAQAPLAFLNLGGVGNITLVDPRYDDPADPGALLAFDTGPANAPINDAMQVRFGRSFDQGGQIAAMGRPDDAALQTFMKLPFFAALPPKSLDRDAFQSLVQAVQGMADADAIATLTQAVIRSVAHGCRQCPVQPSAVYVTGGGRHNKTVMAGLAAALPCPVAPVESVGLDGDMIEAQAFAFLAVRVLRGLPISAPGTTGVAAPTQGGQIAYP